MKKNKSVRKIALHAETLLRLDGGDLGRAGGGATAATDCPPCPSDVRSVCHTFCAPCPSYYITCLGEPMTC
jgi:hypothetical protein